MNITKNLFARLNSAMCDRLISGCLMPCVLALCATWGVHAGAWAGDLALSDVLNPESSGLSPSEMAVWFNNPTNTISGSGEQVALIWQVCSNCSAWIEQSGGDNYAMIFQSADGSVANIIQGGGGHQAIVQAGNGPSIAVIGQSPNSVGNIANINQSSSTLVTNWR